MNATSGGGSILKMAVQYSTRSITKLVIRKMVKMQYLSPSIGESDRQIIQNGDDYGEHYGKCLKELRDMMATKFV